MEIQEPVALSCTPADSGHSGSGGAAAADAGTAPPPGSASCSTDEASEHQHQDRCDHKGYVAKSVLQAIQLINQLTLELNVHEAMHSVRQVALELLDCERVTLFLALKCRQELRGRTGHEGEELISVKFGEGIAGHVAQTGGLMNIHDAYSHPLFNPMIDARTGFRTRNILCCAVGDVAGGAPIAVLQALNKRGDADFSPVDEQHLKLFSVHLGNTLAKIRFYEEAKREKERIAALSTCFKKLAKVSSLDGALATITEAVQELVRAERVVVFLLDRAREVLWTSFQHPLSGHARQIRTRQSDGVIGHCATSRQQVAIDVREDPTAQADAALQQLTAAVEGGSLTSVLLQPVLDPGTDSCLAVLVALNKVDTDVADGAFEEGSFSHSDRDALSVLSMEVADALGARALEVSFASAMSVVAANGANTHNMQLAHMMRAQLLDYCGGDNAPTPDASRCSSMISTGRFHSVSLGPGARSIGGAAGRRSGPHTFEAAARSSSFANGTSGSGARAASLFSSAFAAHSGAGGDTMGGAFSGGLSPRAAGTLSPRRLPRQLSLPVQLQRRPRPGAAGSNGPLSPSGALPSGAGTDGRGAGAVGVAPRPGLASFDLDCSGMGRDELVRVAFQVFMMSGVVEEMGIPEATLTGFLSAVASHYREPGDVPYHNFGHAVHVLHTAWLIVELSGAHQLLSPLEELCLLVAALCHDLDHDGRSNSYHVNAHTELAQRYNDRSVQENHHCALAFAVLRARSANLLEGLPPDDWRVARRLLVDAILATDMSHHFGLTQELQKHPPAFSADSEADRALLIKAILHASDIGNSIRSFRVAFALSNRVHAEFELQAEAERRASLPVTPHMVEASPADRARMEVQFLDYVAGPLWERLAQAFPSLQPCVAQMRFNRRCFAAIASGAVPGLIPGAARGGSGGAADSSSTTGLYTAAWDAAIAAAAIKAVSAATRVAAHMPAALGLLDGSGGLDGKQGQAEGEEGSEDVLVEEDADVCSPLAPPSPVPDRDPIAGLVVPTRRSTLYAPGTAAAAAAAATGGTVGGSGGPAGGPPGLRPASYSGAIDVTKAAQAARLLEEGGPQAATRLAISVKGSSKSDIVAGREPQGE